MQFGSGTTTDRLVHRCLSCGDEWWLQVRVLVFGVLRRNTVTMKSCRLCRFSLHRLNTIATFNFALLVSSLLRPIHSNHHALKYHIIEWALGIQIQRQSYSSCTSSYESYLCPSGYNASIGWGGAFGPLTPTRYNWILRWPPFFFMSDEGKFAYDINRSLGLVVESTNHIGKWFNYLTHLN